MRSFKVTAHVLTPSKPLMENTSIRCHCPESPATLLLANCANDLSILYRHICLSIKPWSRFSADVTRVRGLLSSSLTRSYLRQQLAAFLVFAQECSPLFFSLLGVVYWSDRRRHRANRVRDSSVKMELTIFQSINVALTQFDQRGMLSSQITAERFTHYP